MATTKRPKTSPPKRAKATVPKQDDRESGHASRWTFLTNHSHVLFLLAQDPDLVLREVAQRVGITERAVQRIIVDLEDGGFVEREKVGRQNRYRLITDRALRHPVESHCTIGDLIELVTRTRSPS